MNCQQVRRHWDLFHDSEEEAEVYWQVNEHLRQCPDCAEWFARQSALEETLVQVLQAEAVPTGEFRGPLMLALHRYVASLARGLDREESRLSIPVPCNSAVTAPCG